MRSSLASRMLAGRESMTSSGSSSTERAPDFERQGQGLDCAVGVEQPGIGPAGNAIDEAAQLDRVGIAAFQRHRARGRLAFGDREGNAWRAVLEDLLQLEAGALEQG